MTQADLEAQKLIQEVHKLCQDTLSRFGTRLHPDQRQALEEAVSGFPAYLKEGACEGLSADRAFVKHVVSLGKMVKQLRNSQQSQKNHSGKHR